MEGRKPQLSAVDRLIARCIVAFHFGMWSWGMWLALIAAFFYYSKITAALMTLYVIP